MRVSMALALSLLVGCASGEVIAPDGGVFVDVPRTGADARVDAAPDALPDAAPDRLADVGADVAGEQCSAVLRFLQKDAYRDGPGRTSTLWPPHTTTVLEVSCARDGGAAQVVATAVMENHGTRPEAVDAASGRPILQEVRRVGPVAGTRAELLALVDAYRACECAPGTRFLSLEALQDTAVQSLVGALVLYVQSHLTCTGAVTATQVVDALRMGRIAEVIAALPSCSWNADSGLGQGFDDAVQRALSATLSQYHVCNNDASLQAQLFGTFQATRAVRACDNSSATCHGPRWFYDP